MSWFLRPDKWPITPGDWLKVADDLARAPTRALLDAFASVADALTGRELELRSPSGVITLNLEAVSAQHSSPPIALGALRPGLDLEGLEAVDLEASDVRWDGGRLDRVTVQARNVHLEGGIITKLVAGPIGLVGELDQVTLDGLLAEHAVELDVTLDGTDRATVRVNRWVTATVSAELDGDEVSFPVHRVRVAGIPVPFAERFVTTRTATIPLLPRDLRLTGLASTPGTIRVSGVVDEFREPILLEQVLRAASTVSSHVVLNRPGTKAATERR